MVNRILSKERIDAAYVTEVFINNTDVFNFLPKKDVDVDLLAILAIVNSRLCATYFKTSNVNLDRDAFPKLNVNNLLSLPLPDNFFIGSQALLIGKTEKIIRLTTELNQLQSQFLTVLQSKVALAKPSGKLQEWYGLEFKEFVKELEKAKVKLSLAETGEWLPYFEEQKRKAVALKTEIEKTDREIDRMVYGLYELTEEEVRIVEGK